MTSWYVPASTGLSPLDAAELKATLVDARETVTVPNRPLPVPV